MLSTKSKTATGALFVLAVSIAAAILAAGCATGSEDIPSSTSSGQSPSSASASQTGVGGESTVEEGRKVEASVEVRGDGITKESCPVLVRLEGCCARTSGIVRHEALSYAEDGVARASFEAVAGSYRVSVVPVGSEAGFCTASGERSIVFDDNGREGHAREVAEKRGMPFEEVLELILDAEASEYAATGHVKEWVGTKAYFYLDPADPSPDAAQHAAGTLSAYFDAGDYGFGQEELSSVVASYRKAGESVNGFDKVVDSIEEASLQKISPSLR